MKQKDLAIILVVVVIAGFASYFISKTLFSNEKNRSVEVKTVEAISTDFPNPDKKYFNEQSINPTQTITIGSGQPVLTEQPSEQR